MTYLMLGKFKLLNSRCLVIYCNFKQMYGKVEFLLGPEGVKLSAPYFFFVFLSFRVALSVQRMHFAS